MKKLIFCLFLCFIYFNSYGQDKKDWRGFFEINFGITYSVQTSNYSITSPYLKNTPPIATIPPMVLKIGATFKRKHFWALGLESIQVFGGFFYERIENGEYLGSGTGFIPAYIGIGFYYDYKIISYKRFHILAGVQTSIGYTDPAIGEFSSSNDDFYNPSTGVHTFSSFKQTLDEQKNIIFVYGVGLSFNFEIIKEKLMLGVGAKFIHAPYAVVNSYHVIYEYMNETPLDFYTSNGLMNMNFDLRLKYIF